MNKDYAIGVCLLLFLALIWGLGFVFQRSGMDHLEPFSFNTVRFLLGGLSILPLLWVFPAKNTMTRQGLIRASFWGGLFFFGGISFQQVGLVYTTAGKSAFITGLYIILVPIFSIAIGQVARANVWFAAVLAVIGLFLLSGAEGLRLAYGDSLTVICAGFWALQILVTAQFADRFDGVEFALGQIIVVFLLSLPIALLFENPSWEGIWNARYALLFVGIMDTGLAMILQILGQRRVPATQAGIIIVLRPCLARFRVISF